MKANDMALVWRRGRRSGAWAGLMLELRFGIWGLERVACLVEVALGALFGVGVFGHEMERADGNDGLGEEGV
jgi:hypothetical protein